MIAAEETAARNSARPPDRLPRDAASAIKVFAAHSSTQLIAGAVLVAVAARVWLGHFTWIDAVAALAVWAYFPVNEWLIHVFVLHYRPRKIFGRTIDFYLPVTHRRHHAEPWNLEWIFIPRHVHAMVFPVIALIAIVAGTWRGPVLSALVMYLILGLHYEWSHYLAHIPWCPNIAYYKRRVLATSLASFPQRELLVGRFDGSWRQAVRNRAERRDCALRHDGRSWDGEVLTIEGFQPKAPKYSPCR